jgi:hypothetical protein
MSGAYHWKQPEFEKLEEVEEERHVQHRDRGTI